LFLLGGRLLGRERKKHIQVTNLLFRRLRFGCLFTVVFIGKGTPAPFDPPRKLVIRGPYRFVRNPMYIGAGMTLAGGREWGRV
jgi:protein-S-isoprenylcysteine O-methyltransferase Ste14